MSSFGATLSRWLSFGVVDAAGVAARPPAAPVRAGQVALARGVTASANVPWGVGPPLEPVTVDPSLFGWVGRDAAMSLPTIQRGRDLIISAVSACPFTRWRFDNTTVPPAFDRMVDAGWFDRPDPDRARQWLLAWTCDDLLFYGAAHWRITGRYSDGFPSTFRRIAPGCLDLRDDHAMVTDPLYNAGAPERVALRDIVEFLSPLEGILTNGGRPISIALALDDAAARFASTEVPSGWLQQKEGSEDMSSDEMRAQGDAWSQARRANTTAVLNQWFDWHEATYDPSTLQIVEGRTYQALELSRLSNIPGYLTGAPAGTGMTYLNAEQAKADLIDFGASPLIVCIEQTLSGPNVTPRGQVVRLNQDVWLRNPFNPTPGTDETPSMTNDTSITLPTETP